ncbi:MAG TPA: metal ABC transporter substrate-binding protein [Syntrophorhabdaceae bacterium]
MRRTAPISLIIVLLFMGSASAGINVVATLPWIGSMVAEVGRDKINVTVLVRPGQDPHMVEARPSMVLASRKADMIAYNGLDLEIGYLPILIESSRNPAIQPGKAGNFDCSRFVSVLEKPASVDRSMGDVHPLGNPHYHLSPRNMKSIVVGIARGLGEVDPANAAFYRANGTSLVKMIEERQKMWTNKPLKGKKYLTYHKFFEYLASEYGFEIVGYIEAKPGIPPSSGHIEGLMELSKRVRLDGILTTSSSPRKAPDFIAGRTGLKVIMLPQDVGAVPGAVDWFSLMDLIIAALS